MAGALHVIYCSDFGVLADGWRHPKWPRRSPLPLCAPLGRVRGDQSPEDITNSEAAQHARTASGGGRLRLGRKTSSPSPTFDPHGGTHRQAPHRVASSQSRCRCCPAQPRWHQRSEPPTGSFLFHGPSGVGKTELAKSLADFPVRRRDRDDPHRHVGVLREALGQPPRRCPPGYVRHEEGGQLTKPYGAARTAGCCSTR